MDEKIRELAKFFLLLAIVLAVTFLLTNFIGLSRGGFDKPDSLNLQTFYLIAGIFALGLVCLKLWSVFYPKDDKYGTSIGFAGKGFPRLKIFNKLSLFQIFLISIMIFFSAGLFNFYLSSSGIIAQKTYTGVGFLEKQQFTATDSIIYSTLLIPGSENLGFAFFYAIMLVLLVYIAHKTNMKDTTFLVFYFVVLPLMGGAFGLGNHMLRYAGSELSLTIVFFFWMIGSILTSATGNFIPFWQMHTANNYFLAVQILFSSQNQVILLGVAPIVIAGILLFMTFKFKKKGDN